MIVPESGSGDAFAGFTDRRCERTESFQVGKKKSANKSLNVGTEAELIKVIPESAYKCIGKEIKNYYAHWRWQSSVPLGGRLPRPRRKQFRGLGTRRGGAGEERESDRGGARG